jgi:hypothetical protein
MSEHNEIDPIAGLRAANPTPAEGVPDASLARVSAKVQEHIMSHEESNSRQAGRWRWAALLGGAALTGVLVIALVAAAGGLGRQQPAVANVPTDPPVVAVVPTAPPATPAPAATPTQEPVSPGDGGGMAMCIRYDTALLPTFDQVFDGTVTAIAGDKVTFEVNEGWKNASGSLTLTVPDTSVALVGPMPDFQVGSRYLVSATAGNVTSCGFTIDYDAKEAAAWAAAFK